MNDLLIKLIWTLNLMHDIHLFQQDLSDQIKLSKHSNGMI